MDRVDLIDGKPVEEERDLPFLARKVQANVTVGRIWWKCHQKVERELVQTLPKLFKDVLDDAEEAKDLDTCRDFLCHLSDESVR